MTLLILGDSYTITKRIPVELWMEIFKHLPAEQLLKVRLLNSTFDSLAIPQIYKTAYLNIFTCALKAGDVDALLKVYHYFDDKVQMQVQMKSYRFNLYPFVDEYENCNILAMACLFGSMKMVHAVYSLFNEDEKKEILINGKYEAFGWAAYGGQLDVVQQLVSWSSKEELPLMIKSCNYFPFRQAAIRGGLDVLQQIYDWSDQNERLEMIRAKNSQGVRESYFAFVVSCGNNQVATIEKLRKWMKNCEWSMMMKSDNYAGFRRAVEKGNLQIIVLLYSLAKKKDRDVLKQLLAKRGTPKYLLDD